MSKADMKAIATSFDNKPGNVSTFLDDVTEKLDSMPCTGPYMFRSVEDAMAQGKEEQLGLNHNGTRNLPIHAFINMEFRNCPHGKNDAGENKKPLSKVPITSLFDNNEEFRKQYQILSYQFCSMSIFFQL